ncbi:hypothetical protein [Mycobacterium sp.]|uniref:hypothetical protein n=1 Tax=Mycobacterium sp. TaxID=1785 RepID=UPI0031DD69B1
MVAARVHREVADEVKAGASIQITDRGQSVARLVPLKVAEHALSKLIAAGRLIPATAPRVPLRVEQLVHGESLRSALDELGTLDAIHLATAHSQRHHLVAFCAYDRGLLQAAESPGLPTVCPQR